MSRRPSSRPPVDRVARPGPADRRHAHPPAASSGRAPATTSFGASRERLRLRHRRPPAGDGRVPRGTELLLVSNLNPDGRALGRRQKRGRPVDLNRNGSAGHAYLGPPGSPTYAARARGSEPDRGPSASSSFAPAPTSSSGTDEPLAARSGRARDRLGRARPALRPPRGIRVMRCRVSGIALALGQRARAAGDLVRRRVPRRSARPAAVRRHVAAVIALAGPARPAGRGSPVRRAILAERREPGLQPALADLGGTAVWRRWRMA